MKTTINLFISIIVIGMMSCKKENINVGLPEFLELKATDISNITGNTATAKGTISNEGNSSVTVYGACWSTTVSPTTASDKTSETPAGLNITTVLQDLDPGTTYHIRLYATNMQGTAYSNEITFTTATFGSVTDIDGNVYRTVRIGSQIWMADNLKTSRLNNLGFMPNVTDNTQWANKTSAAYCYHNNNAANNTVYGKLYNWYAVSTGMLAPAGWHVPDSTEVRTLINFLGGIDIAGGALKATTLWNAPNTGATNSSNFTWYPAGSRYGDNGVFVNFGGNGFAWTSTSVSTTDASFFNLGNKNGTNILKLSNLKSSGFSVRCLKD